MATGTSKPYFASRSKIRNLDADSNGNASRSCWMIQLLVGCFVTLKCRIRRRSWLITKKAIEYTEGDRGGREEIHRSDGFPVISKKGEPTFGRFGIPRSSFHPA